MTKNNMSVFVLKDGEYELLGVNETKRYHIKINYIHFKPDAMEIGWSAKNIGFGVLTIREDDNGSYYVETETMGKNFYDQVLTEVKKYLFHKSEIIE